MKIENKDMPAMPCNDIEVKDDDWEVTGEIIYVKSNGLTKREYFAAMAMQGIMHTREYQSMPAIAIDAVMAADALIEELSK